MKIQFFKQFTFEELLEIRNNLCRFQPTQNSDLDEYIGTDRHSTTAHTRTNRCVTFIDMIFVSMAVKGQLVPVPEKTWTVRVDLNDTEDSWGYTMKKESKPSLEDVLKLIGDDINLSRISTICVYEEFYYNLK